MATDATAKVIAAKVPILKFVEARTSLPVDLNLRAQSAAGDAAVIARLRLAPALRPVVLAMKAFLLQRRLSETHTGGVGSYLLFAMVNDTLNAAGLQGEQQSECPPTAADVGVNDRVDVAAAASARDSSARDSSACEGRPALALGSLDRTPGKLLMETLQRFALEPPRPIEARDPARGGVTLGAQAFQYRAVALAFRDAARCLRNHTCLSEVVCGWPADGVLESCEGLRALLAHAVPDPLDASRPDGRTEAIEAARQLEAAERRERQIAQEELQLQVTVRAVMNRLIEGLQRQAHEAQRVEAEVVRSVLRNIVKQVDRAHYRDDSEVVRSVLRNIVKEVEAHVQALTRTEERKRHHSANDGSTRNVARKMTGAPRKCRFWVISGVCRFGDRCRFAHVGLAPSAASNAGTSEEQAHSSQEVNSIVVDAAGELILSQEV